MDIQHFLAQQREKATQFLLKENAEAEERGDISSSSDRDYRRRERHSDRPKRDDYSSRRGDDRRGEDSRRDDYDRNRSYSGHQDSAYHGNGSSYDDDDGGRDRYRDDGRQGYDRRDADGERWINAEPSQTILLRGLPPHLDESDIRHSLQAYHATVKDVRLMKRKDTGASRGFAFVEFQKTVDAQHWMELNQGQMLVGENRINMYYSQPRDPDKTQDWNRTDWTCTRCGVHNFKRRDSCFKCQLSKDESDKLKDEEGSDQIGNNPCNTLLLRGLDALTTEDGIRASLGTTTALQLKNVIVMRDAATGTSRGFGFVEMDSIMSSTQLLDTLTRKGYTFEVDGKAIIVSYAKNTFTTVIATQQANPMVAHTQQQSVLGAPPVPDMTHLQYAAGIMYDPTQQFLDPRTGQTVVQTVIPSVTPMVAMQGLPMVAMPTPAQVAQQQALAQLAQAQVQADRRAHV